MAEPSSGAPAGLDTPATTSRPVAIGTLVLAGTVVLLLGTRQSFVVPYSLGLTPVVVVGYGFALVLLLCWLAGQDLGAPHRPALLLVMGGFLATSLSASALVLRGASDLQASGTFAALLRESWLVALVLVVMVVVRTLRGLEVLMQAVVVGATISAVVGLLQAFAGLDLATTLALPGLVDQGAVLSSALERAGAVRSQGMAGVPLELSAVLTVALPLSVALALAARERGRSGGWWAMTSTILLVGALATVSRSAIIGIAAALAVMAWSWPVRRVVNLLAVVLLGGLLAMATGLSVVTRVVTALTGGTGDRSNASRQNGFSYASQVLPEHWWLGQGAGTYDPRFQPVLDNAYLTRTVEAGLLGLVAAIAMLVGAWFIAARARRRFDEAGDVASTELANGVLGALSAIIVTGLILDIGGFAQISTLQYLLVALAGVAALLSHTAPTRARSTP